MAGQQMDNELTIGASTGAMDPNRPLRLLIVEDSPADAELILAALKHAGTIVSCFKVVDSPALFRKYLNEADFDVILTDHNLINWTGMDSLEILQHSGKDIPLIVVTGSLGDEAAVEYIKSGAADYVLKEHLGHLPTAVGHALREKTSRGHAVRQQSQILRAKREWELTFDSVPDPVFVINEDCRIERANRAASKVFGLPFDEIVGRHCYEVIHGRSDPLPTCPHQCLLIRGQNSQGDIEEPRLGKIFHSSTSILNDPEGALRGCVHVLHDVTERKRTEEALRRQALTFENIYDAVIVVDEDYNITDWNPAATRMFGYEKTEILGRNVSCVHQPEVAEKQMLSIKAGIESAGRWDGEYAFVRKDGTRGIAEIVIVPFRNEGGIPVGTLGVSRDISERRAAEQEIYRLNRALKALSKCSEALLHARDQQQLLDEICEVVVQDGGYRMAWVAAAPGPPDNWAHALASCGATSDYLEVPCLRYNASADSPLLVPTAIRTGQPAVCRDTATDPRSASLREECHDCGFASIIALPLLVEGKVFGALAIYAAETDAFDAPEVELLRELAGNVGFGLESLQARRQKEVAQHELRASEERLRNLIETANEGICTIDADDRVTFVNAKMAAMLGRTPDQVLGRSAFDFADPVHDDNLRAAIRCS
jgi:PAS domain S-box-containing protein